MACIKIAVLRVQPVQRTALSAHTELLVVLALQWGPASDAPTRSRIPQLTTPVVTIVVATTVTLHAMLVTTAATQIASSALLTAPMDTSERIVVVTR